MPSHRNISAPKLKPILKKTYRPVQRYKDILASWNGTCQVCKKAPQKETMIHHLFYKCSNKLTQPGVMIKLFGPRVPTPQQMVSPKHNSPSIGDIQSQKTEFPSKLKISLEELSIEASAALFPKKELVSRIPKTSMSGFVIPRLSERSPDIQSAQCSEVGNFPEWEVIYAPRQEKKVTFADGTKEEK